MRLLKKYFGTVIAYVFLGFLVFYIYSNKDLLEEVASIGVVDLIIIFTLKLLLIISGGFFTKITLTAFSKNIPLKESIYLALLSSAGNYFGPLLGGFGVRAAYLKKKYAFPIVHFAGTLYGFYIISFFVTSLLGLGAQAYIYYNSGIYFAPVAVVFLTILAISCGLFVVKTPKAGAHNNKVIKKIYVRLKQISFGWDVLRENRRLLTKLILLLTLVLLGGLLLTYFEFKALELPVSLPSIIIYTTLGSLSLLISFTPGAIGIRESIYIYSSSVIFISSDTVLQLAAIDRGITLIVLFSAYVYLQFFAKAYKKDSKDDLDADTSVDDLSGLS